MNFLLIDWSFAVIKPSKVLTSAYLKNDPDRIVKSLVYTENSVGELISPGDRCDGSRNGVLTHSFMYMRKSQIHLGKDGFTSMTLYFSGVVHVAGEG